ncbi:hypothetical protein M378DRAFT_593430 [Amanita muscaria Koide BX008]|uniref:Uncharacterized protein n=1 Tax=Amanita muscaria (strain Koide BX008) TaxID=946122 RepID=A0A0C2SM70_AMAMK|nr:hypothetical protein M378DRAFT_593430 [Amanita muscaria Koide BX008]
MSLGIICGDSRATKVKLWSCTTRDVCLFMRNHRQVSFGEYLYSQTHWRSGSVRCTIILMYIRWYQV